MIPRLSACFGQDRAASPAANTPTSRPGSPASPRVTTPAGPLGELAQRYGVTALSPGGADLRLTWRAAQAAPDRHVNARFHDADYGFTARSAERIHAQRIEHRRAAAVEVHAALMASLRACDDPKGLRPGDAARIADAVLATGETRGITVTLLRCLVAHERARFRESPFVLLRSLGDMEPYPTREGKAEAVRLHTGPARPARPAEDDFVS